MVQGALRACTHARRRDRGSKCQGEPSGGRSPARQGRSEERVCVGACQSFGRVKAERKRGTGETTRGGARASRRLTLTGARGSALKILTVRMQGSPAEPKTRRK